MTARNYSALDHCLMNLDQMVRTVLGGHTAPERVNPADAVQQETALSDEQRSLSLRLMRVNHAGEVAAQALYQGQALTARDAGVHDAMVQASREENDHLAWCEGRIRALGGHTSLLNPVWYLGSLVIGAAAGAAGDKWSLGFVAETEHQVVRHLDRHLDRLSPDDVKSRAILEQMREDESHHATAAMEAGGAPLPETVKRLMGLTSKVMTLTAFWL
jgi:ubiquinone biosynthesis monooxygenase Coq7